jgi:putative ABC transport system ATP-binding protein
MVRPDCGKIQVADGEENGELYGTASYLSVARQMGTKAIEARDLKRVHDGLRGARPALAGVSLDVTEGEFLCVLGPSGSGKSTLLAILGGLDRGYEGKVALWGEDLRAMSDGALSRLRGERIGFVFQHFHLLMHLTALENVLTPALFGPDFGAPATRARAMELLSRLGIGDRAEDTPAELSGGQRQRVAIARALLRRPKLLFCDEPTGNLDEETGAQTIALFQEIHREEGLTVVAVTHELRLAAAATRIVRLSDGRIVDPEGST